jgi:hypothetical protein
MSVNLDTLVPQFKAKVLQLLDNCKTAGIIMQPNYAIRTPLEQAKLWRQSRTATIISAEVLNLRQQGADFLADCIENAGPQNGGHVTNAIPGLSWHQWGEALDCVWLVNGIENWSTTQLIDGKNGYHVYADEAKALGLTPGGLWPTFKDWPHVQLRAANSPSEVMTTQEINSTMKQRFGTVKI